MKPVQSLGSLLTLAVAAVGISTSCGNASKEEDITGCTKDSDCSSEQVCNSRNVCIDPGQEMLSYQQKSTLDGRVSFELNGARTELNIKKRDGTLIPHIQIHYGGNSQGEIFVLVDPQRRFQPEVVERVFTGTTSSLSSSQVHQALRFDHVDIPLDPIENGKKIYNLLNSDERQFLGRQGPVNRYCMTLEQLSHSEIEIPAGLVMLASDAAGFQGEKIKVAVTTQLKDIFTNWIVQKYGALPAYEVWVPRTAINACDEHDYGTVCDISTDRLSQRVWNPEGMPYWEIRGGCNSDSPPENPSAPPPQNSDFIHIVSLSPPLTCIQFNRLYSVAVNAEYNLRPISSRCPAQVQLRLSSYGCNQLDQQTVSSTSGNLTLHGEFTPSECDSQVFPVYTLTAELEYCPVGASDSTIALDHRNIPKCP